MRSHFQVCLISRLRSRSRALSRIASFKNAGTGEKRDFYRKLCKSVGKKSCQKAACVRAIFRRGNACLKGRGGTPHWRTTAPGWNTSMTLRMIGLKSSKYMVSVMPSYRSEVRLPRQQSGHIHNWRDEVPGVRCL